MHYTGELRKQKPCLNQRDAYPISNPLQATIAWQPYLGKRFRSVALIFCFISNSKLLSMINSIDLLTSCLARVRADTMSAAYAMAQRIASRAWPRGKFSTISTKVLPNRDRPPLLVGTRDLASRNLQGGLSSSVCRTYQLQTPTSATLYVSKWGCNTRM